MDEVVLTIRGQKHYLWRAVDQDGNVLDMRVAEPPQQKGSQTIFPQTSQRAAIRPSSDHYR
jgi:putative transposase